MNTYLVILKIRNLSDDAFVLHQAMHYFLQVFLGDARLHLRIKFYKQLLNLVLFPFNQLIFNILAKVILIKLFHRGSWNTNISLGFEELSGSLHFGLLFTLETLLDLGMFTIQVSLTLGKAVALLLGNFCACVNLFGGWTRSLRQPILFLTDFFGPDPFSNGYDMSIENINLWHQVNNFQPVVGLFSKWISE